MSATPHRRAVSSPVIAYVGDEYPARTAGEGELRHEVADRAAPETTTFLPVRSPGARGGVRPYGGRLDHRAVFEREGFRQFDEPLLRNDEIVLCGSVGLECLHPEVLADVVLAPAAGGALAAGELRTGRHLVARFASGDLGADGRDDAGIFVSLHHRVECRRVLAVVGVNLAAADADFFDAD